MVLQTEPDQDTAGIRRELDSGAGFLQPLGPFHHHDAKAARSQRQRRRQSSDPGTCNEDGARGRHASVPLVLTFVSCWVRLRMSEPRGHQQIILSLVWLWFGSPHDKAAAALMRTSKPPHGFRARR